jgi:DNA-directed RNA polymerase specialized sigma subunit
MKIHYHRYSEMGCFTIRGLVGANEWKMLQLGFNLLFKELQEMLIINMTNADIATETVADVQEYKKGIAKQTKHKVFIISKEKGVGDFPKFELLLSRFQGSKMRQIGDRIILEDQIYNLERDIAGLEAQIVALGFDENSSKKEIQRNSMVKAQKKSLDGCLKWQRLRKTTIQKVPSDMEDLDNRIKANVDELAKILGKPVNL